MIKFTIAVCALVVGLVIFGGFYLLLKGGRNVQRALASTKWPRTAGLVVSSDTSRNVTVDRDTREASVTFSTRTIIRYQVNGREYTTDVLHFGQTLGSGDKSDAALLHLRYPEGSKVNVSYDPSAPWIGVLKPGLHPEAFWLPGASLALLIPAAICLLIAPGFVRSMTAANQPTAFEESVHKAIEDAQRGVMPADSPFPPPPRAGGDKVMPVVAFLFGAIACGLGILALNAGLQRIWRGQASVSWPTTPGIVVFTAKGGGDNADGSTDNTSDPTSYTRFVYQYKVAGADHFNNVRRFAQVEGGGGSEEVDRIESRYHKGAKVTVSYFPTDPDVSVLEPGNTSASLLIPGLGVALILFSAAVFIWIVPAVAKS